MRANRGAAIVALALLVLILAAELAECGRRGGGGSRGGWGSSRSSGSSRKPSSSYPKQTYSNTGSGTKRTYGSNSGIGGGGWSRPTGGYNYGGTSYKKPSYGKYFGGSSAGG